MFEVNLKVVAKDTIGFGSKMLGTISHLGIDITKIFAKQSNGECEFKLTLKLKNSDELKKVMDKIAKVETRYEQRIQKIDASRYKTERKEILKKHAKQNAELKIQQLKDLDNLKTMSVKKSTKRAKKA